MAKGAKKQGKDKKKAKAPKLAKQADKYALYEQSVQAPDVDVVFFGRLFKTHFSRVAQSLREDFCGTFAVCCEWVKRGGDHVAYGVDLDPECLAWGREHNLAPLTESQQQRVHPIEGDVLSTPIDPVDVLVAQNFSYCIFKTREALKDYFRTAYAGIAKEGLFVTDLFGGYESLQDEHEEITDHDDFEYVWDQHKYDPINAFGTYKIHFRFPDGSEMKNAFVYDWRLWTIPEVREVMLEVGFDDVEVFWEGTDPKTGEGTGRYHRATQGESDPGWVAYIVGLKKGA